MPTDPGSVQYAHFIGSIANDLVCSAVVLKGEGIEPLQQKSPGASMGASTFSQNFVVYISDD
jgi:hypothetical protein